LKENDAGTSWRWRNDPAIWVYTGLKPNIVITEEIEKKWIIEVLKRHNESRFAICAGDDRKYIGNVQLTNITTDGAEFHIFIGDKAYRNQGLGTKATNLILAYARKELKLSNVYLFVNEKNIAAIKTYKKCGFIDAGSVGEQLKMTKQLQKTNA